MVLVAHDTKTLLTTWPNCSFYLCQKCNPNQPVWNVSDYLIGVYYYMGLLLPPHLPKKEEAICMIKLVIPSPSLPATSESHVLVWK